MRPARYFPRYLCDLPATIHSPAARVKLSDARVQNIGIAGIGVCCPHLSRRVPYEFRFACEGRALRLTGRVAWEAPRGPKNAGLHRYGIAFNLSAAQEALLKEVVDRLKAQAAPVAAGDYWAGGRL